jgi:hypothetical protein
VLSLTIRGVPKSERPLTLYEDRLDSHATMNW